MAFLRTPVFVSRVARRRWLVAGAVGGIALGSAVGTFALAQPSDLARAPAIRVLHAAPAFVVPGAALGLSAATVCDRPADPACIVTGAAVSVRGSDDRAWTRVAGHEVGGAYRFVVPASRIGADGFDYRLSFRTADGGTTPYPPSGVPLHVSSTAGLARTERVASFSWSRVRQPDRSVLSLRYGEGPGEVGVEGGGPGRDLLGPSSFAVGPEGSISVADWVNDRVEVFRRGTLRDTFRTPVHRTFDLAVGTGGQSYLQTLGTDGTTYEVDAAGAVVGRYPAGFGVAARVTTTSTGPAVSVGPAQWVSVRFGVGVARAPALQAATATAAPVGSNGASSAFGVLDDHHVALTWTRSDGTGSGAVLALPEGTRAGTEYFAEPLPGGGSVLALGLWNDDHNGVGLFRFGEDGSLTSFSLLPEPSTRADARASTVRWAGGRVLEVLDRDHGMSIVAFDLGGDR